MSSTLLIKEIQELLGRSDEQVLRIVHHYLQTTLTESNTSDYTLTQEQHQEIDRRVEEYKNGNRKTYSLEEVNNRMEKLRKGND